jgi:hypothetical protein
MLSRRGRDREGLQPASADGRDVMLDAVCRDWLGSYGHILTDVSPSRATKEIDVTRVEGTEQ